MSYSTTETQPYQSSTDCPFDADHTYLSWQRWKKTEESRTDTDSGPIAHTWSTADYHAHQLPTDRLSVKRPIPIRLWSTMDGEVMASLDEAEISMQGEDVDDAYNALLYDIVDAYECLVENKHDLGIFMQWQLSILSEYIDLNPS